MTIHIPMWLLIVGAIVTAPLWGSFLFALALFGLGAILPNPTAENPQQPPRA
jgi:hypothetical protein